MARSEPYDFAEELFVDLAERGEVGVEESKTASPLAELGAGLFFFVVAGQEDLAVLVKAVCLCVARRQVNQTFDGVGRRRTHRREDSGGV